MQQLLRMVKVIIILFCICLQVRAKGFTQITLSEKNVPLQKVFAEIQKQSGYDFLCTFELLQQAGRVTVKVKNVSLKEALDASLRGTGLTYLILDKTIVIRVQEKAKSIESAQVILQLPIDLTGKVVDEQGAPLAGATVKVRGDNKGTTTDANGYFMLKGISENTSVDISFVGFEPITIVVKNENNLTIVLKKRESKMEDVQVVVVGYQTRRRSDLSGAVSVVDVNGMAKLPVLTVDQALQGKAPGVRITQNTGQPGEGVSVRIRGVGTINDNNPLFIIDGVPTKDGINFLSPNDIESLVVLKDASSAAIYGARASNGVILITTKAGKRGQPQFNYSGYGGVQVHGTLPEMTNTQEYVTLYNEAVDNDNAMISNPVLKRKPITSDIPMANTDWLGAIFQTAPIQNHQISVSGGNDKTLYYVSGNYSRQDGIILNSWYERYALLTKLNVNLSDRLSLGNSINLSYSKKNKIGSSGDGYGGNGGSVVRYALFRTPPIPIYDSEGVYSDLPLYPNFFGDGYNPVALANKTDNKEAQYRVFTNLNLEYKINNNLRFKTDAGPGMPQTPAERPGKAPPVYMAMPFAFLIPVILFYMLTLPDSSLLVYK
jgi:TonB-linked SusC/RagA family outer membrane protein